MALITRIMLENAPHFAEVGDDRYTLLNGTPWEEINYSDRSCPVASTATLLPVLPTKIIGVGKNYGDHAKEMGGNVPSDPLLFLKPPSTMAPSGSSITLPSISQHVDFEAELGVIIGKRAKNVPKADALDYVFGYIALCDLTARDLQKKDGQWARAKGCDGFCPIGPSIQTELTEPHNQHVKLWKNGELKQNGNTSDMVFDIPTLIAYISEAITLEPGDIIATGTPSGVGPLTPGDSIIVEVGSMPQLEFRVTSSQ